MTTRRTCNWPGDDALMQRYHDTEWGVPVDDDRTHFEFLILEGAQAGLSWRTILHRREGYRRAYAGFDAQKVAAFGPKDITRLVGDPGIIRNRLKIEWSIKNARQFLEIQDEFGGFSRYIWRFVDGRPKKNRWRTLAELPATSPESDALSQDLKQRGLSFVGSTIMYAHMQATGLVNDHLVRCFRYRTVATSGRSRRATQGTPR